MECNEKKLNDAVIGLSVALIAMTISTIGLLIHFFLERKKNQISKMCQEVQKLVNLELQKKHLPGLSKATVETEMQESSEPAAVTPLLEG